MYKIGLSHKLSRTLWENCGDINDVLTENTGTKAIQGIVLKLHKQKEELRKQKVIGIKIEVYGTVSKPLLVKKCGLRMVYKKDTEDLNFDNSMAMAAEGYKAKRTRDELINFFLFVSETPSNLTRKKKEEIICLKACKHQNWKAFAAKHTGLLF
ncbi:hypothetical protein CMV_025940 [Castanea mollissima]|uniref:Uncharacterized protein n=1 Tax=Castanea mollissima TaxID=60419 RepID=A0A8J4VAX3_9ROSI|nr:hypothetical protein CMV_025940 [Castanea mollissima]